MINSAADGRHSVDKPYHLDSSIRLVWTRHLNKVSQLLGGNFGVFVFRQRLECVFGNHGVELWGIISRKEPCLHSV
ncbi:MAG: hypothetical protein DLM55_12015 [Acidimicrobiales bacterium]|nr:MAG: hypothetical protein DLM55_12015 [Acidimicrobiales bacterium]